MGGEDFHDQHMAYYRMCFSSRTEHLCLVFQFIEMYVVNSWILYRPSQDELLIPRHKQSYLSKLKLRL